MRTTIPLVLFLSKRERFAFLGVASQLQMYPQTPSRSPEAPRSWGLRGNSRCTRKRLRGPRERFAFLGSCIATPDAPANANRSPERLAFLGSCIATPDVPANATRSPERYDDEVSLLYWRHLGGEGIDWGVDDRGGNSESLTVVEVSAACHETAQDAVFDAKGELGALPEALRRRRLRARLRRSTRRLRRGSSRRRSPCRCRRG